MSATIHHTATPLSFFAGLFNRKGGRRSAQVKAAEPVDRAADPAAFFAGLFERKAGGLPAQVRPEASTPRREGELAAVTAARLELARLESVNRALKGQVAQFNSEWPAIEAALSRGDLNAAALQTEFGLRIGALVSKGIAKARPEKQAAVKPGWSLNSDAWWKHGRK